MKKSILFGVLMICVSFGLYAQGNEIAEANQEIIIHASEVWVNGQDIHIALFKKPKAEKDELILKMAIRRGEESLRYQEVERLESTYEIVTIFSADLDPVPGELYVMYKKPFLSDNATGYCYSVTGYSIEANDLLKVEPLLKDKKGGCELTLKNGGKSKPKYKTAEVFIEKMKKE